MTSSLRGSDLPRTTDYFDQYLAEVDTPQNRAALVEQMTDAACDQFKTWPENAQALRAAIYAWVDAQDGAAVVEWMRDHGIVPDYETWVAS